MCKIIVNLFYVPHQELKNLIEMNSSLYVPVNGGSTLQDDPWCREHVYFDNTGDNISSHNLLLNEFTSIYWFWKHINEFGGDKIDYVGFNHYRRFFSVFDMLDYQDFDMILAKTKTHPKFTLAQQYAILHNIDDVNVMFKAMQYAGVSYDETKKFYQYFTTQKDMFAPCNMFVMKRELFNEWCTYIFPILFMLEKTVDMSNRDNYQRRAICFLAERLFGFWCKQKIGQRKMCLLDIVERKYFKPPKVNERNTYDQTPELNASVKENSTI